MNRVFASLVSGLAGSLALTALNLGTQRLAPRKAPRLEKLGMQGLSRIIRLAGGNPPKGRKLFNKSMLGHLAANGLYYSLIGTARPGSTLSKATALGAGAGLGSVFLPKALKMDQKASAMTKARAATNRRAPPVLTSAKARTSAASDPQVPGAGRR